MVCRCFRIALLLTALLFGATPIFAQQPDTLASFNKRLSIGIELPRMLANPFAKGYSFQPVLLADVTPAAVVWVGAGIMQEGSDAIYSNLYNYRSTGGFLKAGGDLKLNLNKQTETGFRFGAGISVARFTEKGEIRLGYTSNYPEQDMEYPWTPSGEESVYREQLKNSSWSVALELRQGLFVDAGKIGFLLLVQESWLLREPENPLHPTHYIPGTGILTPAALVGRGNSVSREIIPAVYLSLFYRLR